MRPYQRLLSLLCVLILLLSVCGCTQTPPTAEQVTPQPTQPVATEAPFQLEYEQSFCTFAEPYGGIYDTKRSQKTEYNGITYHFASKIDLDRRQQIVLESDRLVTILLADHPDYKTRPTLCFAAMDYPARVHENTLYIGEQYFGTPEFAVAVSWALFGYHVNYGIVYAHGIRAAEQMDYKVTDTFTDIRTALKLCDRNREYLDLNYACFLPVYTKESTLEQVRSLAVFFYDYLREHDRLDLLCEYSDETYCQYLSDFIAQYNKAPYDNSDLNGAIFYNGGPFMRLVWADKDAVFYIRADYQISYLEGHLTEDMVGSSYENLRRLVVDYQLQADYMEERLGKYEPEDNIVDVHFTERFVSDSSTAANYTYTHNLIQMFSVGSYIHEYTHHLLRGAKIDLWMNELVCYYYSYYPLDPQLNYRWEDEISYAKNASITDPNTENYAYFISLLRNKLGGQLVWSNPDDFEYFAGAYVVLTSDYPQLTNPNAGALSKVSFMNFLIDLSSEEKALEAIVTNTPEKIFGKSWETLIRQWENALKGKYAWLHDYYIIKGE